MIDWRKSSHSEGGGTDCVEVAQLSNAVGLRDSKHPGQGHQAVSPQAFASLVSRIKSGAVDL
jgi:hypothetical protein